LIAAPFWVFRRYGVETKSSPAGAFIIELLEKGLVEGRKENKEITKSDPFLVNAAIDTDREAMAIQVAG